MKAILGGVLDKIPRPTPALAVALLALLIAASGAAVAAIPSNGTITACYAKNTGSLRVIDAGQTCSSKEMPLAWKDGINGKVADSLHADQADNATSAANADKLDNKDSVDFYAAGSKVADSDKLDNKDSTDFLGANQTAADSAKLGGQSPSAYLGANQKATDSDKLDGQDSTAFARADQFGSAVNAPILDGSGGLDCYLGEVRLFAGAAPNSWAKANGQLLSINQNQALFSLLGTNYGGDGRITFALPDLRGAEPKGAGPAAPYYAICIQGVYP
jgi:hypothetical protein